MTSPDRSRSTPVTRSLLVAAAFALILAAAACRPVALGGASNRIGNDVSACPQFQPATSAPCGPQPHVWAAIQAPYQNFADGDPYATKCGRNLTVSVAACSSGSYAGGATNELYDPTGYEYVIDVGADDVGVPLTFEIWDAGSYPRNVGSDSVTTRTATVTMTSGSDVLTRTAGTTFSTGDVGRSITGTGIAPGTTVAEVVSASQIRISAPALSSGTGRTVTIATLLTFTGDCNQLKPPFNQAPYNGTVGSQNCQTGDSGSSPFQAQVFRPDGDGQNYTQSYDEPIDGCHLYVAANAGAATYKNTWATVCTFTPAAEGQHPVRIKSSAIVLPDGAAVTDTGSGWNAFAMRVTGGAASRLYATGALSIWSNTPAGDGRFYLAEITRTDAGKRLQLDLFDPGDGTSGEYAVQVLAPPSGAPSPVPTSGAVIPAAGIVDSCRFNPTPSPTRGPDVSGAGGADAPACSVATRISGTNIYNNHWLRIEIDISPDYACATDCWWTIRYQFGGTTGIPSDRTVWVPQLIPRPADPAPTTTSTTSTTSTTAPETGSGTVATVATRGDIDR